MRKIMEENQKKTSKLLIGSGLIVLILAVSGCTSSTQIFGGTGKGSTYGKIMTVEHFQEYFCDNWLVYFENDMGTGGDTRKQTAGSYCIKDNDPELIRQLQEYGASGIRVKADYETAYYSICGCDYQAWINHVEPAKVEKP